MRRIADQAENEAPLFHTTMRLGCVQKAVRLAVGGMLAGFLFAGCSSSSTGKPVAGLSGDPIADGHRMMEAGKPEDRLLWGYRGAAAAMRRGQYSDAKRFLDEAVDRLNGMLGRDRTARKARPPSEACARGETRRA